MIHAAATRKLVAPERARLIKALVASGIADPDAWLDDARQQVLDYLDRNGPTPARDIGRQVPALRRPLVLGSGGGPQRCQRTRGCSSCSGSRGRCCADLRSGPG